jgi:hypothetical protein
MKSQIINCAGPQLHPSGPPLSMNGIVHIIVSFKTSDLMRGQIVSELTRR